MVTIQNDMTNEEAINHIENMANALQIFPDSKQGQALLRAIKALEQTNSDEDCISRKPITKAINEMLKWINSNNRGIDDYFIVDKIEEIISELDIQHLPSIQPKAKVGHWIGHREHCESLGVMPSGLGTYEWCSNCDCGIDAKEWHRNNYNYCPNCGAKMVEPQESEE